MGAHINDAWAGLVEEILESGRNAWGYLVPDDLGERRRLRQLCREMRAFENHFLALYREHLLGELRADAGRRLHAINRLGQILYPDAAIAGALQALAAGGEPAVRQAAQQALATAERARARNDG